MSEKLVVTEDMCISKWRKLLSVFHQLVKDDAAHSEFISLKEMAKGSHELTPRQVEGISERCDNYINGEYGNTKKPEHYSQEHNHSLKK